MKNIKLKVVSIIIVFVLSTTSTAQNYQSFGIISKYSTHVFAQGYAVIPETDRLYIGNGQNGLTILNISNGLESLEEILTFPTVFGPRPDGVAHAPVVKDNLIYIANGYGFYVLNNTDLEIEVLTYRRTTHAIYTNVHGETMYLSDGSSNTVKVYNVTNPSEIAKIEEISVSGFAERSIIYENILIQPAGFGVEIFNIENPGNTTLISNIATGDTSGVDLVYPYLYVASKDIGVEIIDVSDFTSPQIIQTILTSEQTRSVGVKDDVLVAGNQLSIEFFDISNIDSIELIKKYDTVGLIYDIQFHDDYVTYIERNNGFVVFGEIESVNETTTEVIAPFRIEILLVPIIPLIYLKGRRNNNN